jgi:hypothetical protein
MKLKDCKIGKLVLLKSRSVQDNSSYEEALEYYPLGLGVIISNSINKPLDPPIRFGTRKNKHFVRVNPAIPGKHEGVNSFGYGWYPEDLIEVGIEQNLNLGEQ